MNKLTTAAEVLGWARDTWPKEDYDYDPDDIAIASKIASAMIAEEARDSLCDILKKRERDCIEIYQALKAVESRTTENERLRKAFDKWRSMLIPQCLDACASHTARLPGLLQDALQEKESE